MLYVSIYGIIYVCGSENNQWKVKKMDGWIVRPGAEPRWEDGRLGQGSMH